MKIIMDDETTREIEFSEYNPNKNMCFGESICLVYNKILKMGLDKEFQAVVERAWPEGVKDVTLSLHLGVEYHNLTCGNALVGKWINEHL